MVKNIKEHNENVGKNDRKLALLKEQFASCFKKDGSFDIELFKEELKDKVDVVHEGYELRFLGKSYANLLASLETTTVIVPNIEHNSLPENKDSENIYISGDNLDGLKHLLKSYDKKVKCIYIDPPYNTGSDGFVYKDNFKFTANELQERLSLDPTQAKRVIDLTKRNSASHSAWLMFMYSRLKLAKELLTDDGVIFISIDDNEQANLKLLCDDVFGEENFVVCLATIMNLKGNNDQFGFAGTHEYTMIYSKNKNTAKLYQFNLNEEELEDWEEDSIGLFKQGANLKATGINGPREKRPNLFFPVFVDSQNNVYVTENDEQPKEYIGEIKKILPITNEIEMSWRWSKNKFKSEKHNLIILRNGSIGLYKKQRPSLGELPSKKPKSIFYKPQYSSGNGTEALKKVFNSKVFNNPKPIELLKDFLEVATINNDIVLDFFSGSATTAHAVMQLNAEDGGNRKFIAVQLPEVLEDKDESQKSAYNFLKENKYSTTLDYIGIERIKRAAKKIEETTPTLFNKEGKINGDFGFKHFILNEPDENTLDKCESFNPNGVVSDETILETFGVETVLTTWLNYDGYGLNAKVENVDLEGYEAYYCGEHLYLINAQFNLTALERLFKKYNEDKNFNPEKVVVFGYSFEWSILETLEKNLKIMNDSVKNLKINCSVRY